MSFKSLKQRIDAWAIKAAAATLPEPQPRPDQAGEARQMIESGEFCRPPVVPLPEIRVENFGALGQGAMKFQFQSTVQTKFADSNMVRGLIYAGTNHWQRQPFVLLVHGWNAELHYHHVMPKVARSLADRGFAAAALELPFHSQRRPRPPERIRNFISDDLPTMLTATRQALADIDAILRGAREGGCPWTALWGFSLGGWLAGLHLREKPQVDAAILTTPISRMDLAIRDLAFCAPIRAALANCPVDLSRLNLSWKHPGIPPDNILLHQAEYDLFVSSAEYDQIAGSWELRERQRDMQSHITVLVSPKSMKECMDWLAGKARGEQRRTG